MNSEWQRTTIGAQATLQRGFDITKAEQRSGSVPVVSSAGISSWHDVPMVKGPGVVLGRKGVVGSVHFIAQDFWPHDTSLWVKDFHGNEPRFVYYFFRAFAKELSALDVGSANPTLNRNHVHPIEVPWPGSLKEQRSIADALGKIDDRITLLRETNATLEAIAQALFKSWFVDFDPVRAKMEGRAPEGMDEATAALFPDGFEESELGLVPKGWHGGPLGEVARTIRKQLQPSELHAGLHYVGLEHMPRKSLSLVDWATADGLESAKAAFQEGDVLFGKLRPYFHKVVIAPFDGVCSTDVLVCQAVKPAFKGFVAMQLFSDALVGYAERLSNGAKMPRVNWSDLADYPVVVPTEDVAQRFTEAVGLLFAQMKAATQTAQTLATLRDTLLPRLISGQLRLPDSDIAVDGEMQVATSRSPNLLSP